MKFCRSTVPEVQLEVASKTARWLVWLAPWAIAGKERRRFTKDLRLGGRQGHVQDVGVIIVVPVCRQRQHNNFRYKLKEVQHLDKA